MPPPNEKQLAVDSDIQGLLVRIVELKRLRNSLASISRLPAEILSMVFYWTLRFDTQDPLKRWTWNFQGRTSTYDYVRMSHVCRSWRTIAHNTPELWTRLQAYPSTKVVGFEHLWAKSKSLLVSLRIRGKLGSLDYSYVNNFKHILSSGLAKLKDLSLIMEGSAIVRLSEDMTGRAEHLRSLELIGSNGRNVEVSSNLLAGGTPDLRRVYLQHCILPWTSAILHSPHLTHLTVHDTAPPTVDSLAKVVAVLRQLTQIEVFVVGIPEPVNPIRPTIPDSGSRPVEVPRMRRFKLSSLDLEPLAIILSAIRLPDTIQDVVLQFRRDGISTPPLQELNDACSSSFLSGFSPNELVFDRDAYNADYGYHLSATRWIAPPTLNSLNEGIAQCIQIRNRYHRVHPSYVLTSTRPLWSFDNLRSLKARDAGIPEVVWEILAAAPFLETIEVDAHATFFNALRGKTSTYNASGILTGTLTTSVSPPIEPLASSMQRFPALQHLTFLDIKVNFTSAKSFIQDVVDTFKERGGKKLAQLEFRQVWKFSASEVESLDIETPLSTIAERVKWGQKVLDLPKLDDVVVTRSKAKGTVGPRRVQGSGKGK